MDAAKSKLSAVTLETGIELDENSVEIIQAPSEGNNVAKVKIKVKVTATGKTSESYVTATFNVNKAD